MNNTIKIIPKIKKFRAILDDDQYFDHHSSQTMVSPMF